MELQTFLQFMVALFMSLGGVCIFIWAVLSGQFNNVEDPKHKALQLEVFDYERRDN
jgi:cbb3-type cytochrome oxidase maturation protein